MFVERVEVLEYCQKLGVNSVYFLGLRTLARNTKSLLA